MASPTPIVPRRVAITGMGVACGLGLDVEEFWSALLEGRSGVRSFAADRTEFRARCAGRLEERAFEEALDRREIKEPDRTTRLGLHAVGGALDGAGLRADGSPPLDYDLLLGSGHGGVISSNEAVHAFITRGYRAIRPTAIVRGMFNRPANVASIFYQLTGACHGVGAACASSSVALGEAYHRVRFGLAPGAVAGGCDSGLDLFTFACWNRLGVLSKIEPPEAASRPFDRDRDGLVLGEGAAAFVLEPWETAEQRGVEILAEVVGYGSSCDATHIVQPSPEGQGRALRAALSSASLRPEQIDYVNAHGTATDLADVVEAESLGLSLGDHARAVPVSSTKGQLGHLMGATAGVELVATIQALRQGLIPPCQNLDDPDPRCPLNFVRRAPREAELRYALKCTFAFGGTNSAVILKRV